MRLLGYWIVFMVLLVAFIPALSLVYSPAYNIAQPCPECPTIECPVVECPECDCPVVECPPPPECPVVYPQVLVSYVVLALFWHGFDVYEAVFSLRIPQGYKAVVVFPFPSWRVIYVEIWDTDTGDYWSWAPPQIKHLNSTHSYIEIYESVRHMLWYHVIDVKPWEWYRGQFLTVYVMREDVSVYDILR